jgi:hypothetical protein
MESASPDYELGCREGNHSTLDPSDFHETGLTIDDIVRVYEGDRHMLFPDRVNHSGHISRVERSRRASYKITWHSVPPELIA